MPLKKVDEDNNVTTEEERIFDKKFFTLFQIAIQKEMEPIYRAVHEVAGQLKRMEERIAELEKHVVTQNKSSQDSVNKEKEIGGEIHESGNPAVIYQEIKVERLFIDKFDQITNLGNLGIRELSGQLTIGTTYESDAIPEDSIKEMDEDYKNMKEVLDKFSEKKKKVEEDGRKE